mgnify:CR=1 FL=1
MRLNKFIAQASGLSRRVADQAIVAGRVKVNGSAPSLAQNISGKDVVTLDDKPLNLPENLQTVVLNKPVGYVCSRDGQGSKTIYELLPKKLHHLKPVGRLDKNSSGLLLLTNDGNLAHELTHPKFQKSKVYKIALNKPFKPADLTAIQKGVRLEDGLSRLELERINNTDDTNWKVIMSEGRNRQIRRTFDALGYNVVKLHRTHFGTYVLGDLKIGEFTDV